MKMLCCFLSIFSLFFSTASIFGEKGESAQPKQPVKLIFIHHSTGENWLTDGYGDLGRTLDENNYFVSDTNYGWGPNAIGDRTDIPDWLEWFQSDQTDQYMRAVFLENGQHSSYSRELNDPGGENQIIMFKSCFPNSDLSGSPDDGAGDYAELSVSGAKYVYNEILTYFATKPDKMFVVITAPPLSDRTHAANARAFNLWLVNDWLKENDYTIGNVFVFDFYNVLTGDDAHHFLKDGSVEHIVGNQNTLFYPSGDDHPSVEGSQKATREFVPLLNHYYQQWISRNPPPAVIGSVTEVAGITEAPMVPLPPRQVGLIDDFESGSLLWESFNGEISGTQINCELDSQMANSGESSLAIAYDIPPDSWATCVLFFDPPVDWNSADAVAFDLLANTAEFDVSLYVGSEDARETYFHSISTLAVTADVWVPCELRWQEFHRADWEEDAGAPLSGTSEIRGIAFGFSPLNGKHNSGNIWIDNLHLVSRTTENAPAAQMEDPTAIPDIPPETPSSRLPICGLGLLLPMILALMFWFWRIRA